MLSVIWHYKGFVLEVGMRLLIQRILGTLFSYSNTHVFIVKK
ncbi:unnamed protein product [Linum tenue]|uniref:Uncharacterized protein n=1 Tax=Linum tenue TaxID=586396 RepID=A0AAV0I3A3_9ROSI|nr:unnamed protein product [Linum tenue]